METSSSPLFSFRQTPNFNETPEPSFHLHNNNNNNNKPTKKTFMKSLKQAATTSFTRSTSFKQDTYIISNLKPSESKALNDLKQRLSSNSYETDHHDTMWGISLLSSDHHHQDPSSDVILLKFLRARDFKVTDALTMLEKCLGWRKEFGTDNIVEEDLGFKELEGLVAYMHGFDRTGQPVCYNAYGVFKDKEMYERIFGDEEKLQRFLRWRVQVLERGIRLLHFKPGGINSIIQVTDLKDMPKRELRVASKHILSLFQDNYPEMVARKIFINVPWYFSMLYSMFSPFLTQRTKSKFVIAREGNGNVAETLYKFIKPENIPIQYGGLSRPGDLQDGSPNPATEFTVKGGEKVNLEIDGIEAGSIITWDIVVGGWDLDYSVEFIPTSEQSYTIAIQKPMRVAATLEEPIHNSFTSKEAGKMVLTIDNTSSKKKKVAAYRYFVRKLMFDFDAEASRRMVVAGSPLVYVNWEDA